MTRNGVARAKSVSIYLGEKNQRKSASLGDWQRGQFCDLDGWQAFYRSNTNYPANPQPQDPAYDVLFALQKYDPILAELRTASERPYSVFPVHYEDGFGVLLSHLNVLGGLTRLTQLRALANLEAGRSEEALADVKLGLCFARSIQSEPLLISQLVRLSMLQRLMQPIWEGLVKHRWTDAQLGELQKMLAPFHLLEDYGSAMRGERACTDQALAQLRLGRIPGWHPPGLVLLLMPTGWFYQNQLVMDRIYQNNYLPMVDAAQRQVYPERGDTNAVAAVLQNHSPYTYFARMMMPDFLKASVRFAFGQTSVDFANVACALERCRLANGRLPDTLAALEPRFIEKLPADVFEGQPLHYHPKPDGSYVLYSVGWNKTDDGGKVVLTKGTTPRINLERGDWVWACPAK